MSLYFYHFRTPQGNVLPEHKGSEHGSDEEAVSEAGISAAELLRGDTSCTRGGANEIHDAAGWFVETVPVWRH